MGNYPIGTKAVFGCGYGFALSNSTSRTCMSNTSWNGQTPTCTLGITYDTYLYISQNNTISTIDWSNEWYIDT